MAPFSSDEQRKAAMANMGGFVKKSHSRKYHPPTREALAKSPRSCSPKTPGSRTEEPRLSAEEIMALRGEGFRLKIQNGYAGTIYGGHVYKTKEEAEAAIVKQKEGDSNSKEKQGIVIDNKYSVVPSYEGDDAKGSPSTSGAVKKKRAARGSGPISSPGSPIPPKFWRVSILDEQEHKVKYVELGPKSEKADVMEQLKRSGTRGEVLAVEESSLASAIEAGDKDQVALLEKRAKSGGVIRIM